MLYISLSEKVKSLLVNPDWQTLGLAIGLVLVTLFIFIVLLRKKRINRRVMEGLTDAEKKLGVKEEKEKKKKEDETEINKIMGYDFVKVVNIDRDENGGKKREDREYVNTSLPGWETKVVMTVESSSDRREKDMIKEQENAPEIKETPAEAGGKDNQKERPEIKKEHVPLIPESEDRDEEEEWMRQCWEADNEALWSSEEDMQSAAREYFNTRGMTDELDGKDKKKQEKTVEQKKNMVSDMMNKWRTDDKARQIANDLAEKLGKIED